MSSSSKRLQRSRLAACVIAALVASPATTALAQQTATDAAASQTAKSELDRVTVTGSRIKRAEAEGPSPVTVISAEQISREGFNTVHDALQTITQNTGFGQNDFNAAGGFTPNASVVNLRGLGPGRTLLLINGRRANDYPFPYNGRSNFQNLNSIPAAAVERVEILSGGASAIYGSDAVAGVINVILKKNFEGDVINLKGQTSTRGGRDIGDLQWIGGRTGSNWSVTYAFESFNSEPLFGYQRDFMDSAADNPAPPGSYPARGSYAGNGVGGYQPPIGIQIRGQGVPTAGSYRQPAGRNCSGSPYYRPWTYTSSASGVTLGPGCGFDQSPAFQTVKNGNNDLSGYIYGTYAFDNGVEAWSSIMAYHSKSDLGGGTEQWFGGPQPNATFYDPQFGIRILPIRTLSPESYGGVNGTFQKFKEDSIDLAFGLRGTIADRFDWDFTIGGARYDAVRDRPRMTVTGATNYFLGQRLGTTGQGAYAGLAGIPNGQPVYRLNLDHFYGPITAADYASMSTMVHYDGQSENAAATFVLSGDLFDLPAGPLGFASVVEASHQSYDLVSDSRIFPSVREIYNLTGTGGGGKRDRYAVGTEFNIPVTSMLTATLAGRYDKYDDITDVDDAKTWAAGLEFRPFKSLLLRGNYATSFKAPDMHYVFAEPSGSFGAITDYARCQQAGITPASCPGAGATYNYSAFTTSQGQPSLREETGKSWTAGFVWDATDSLSLQADYYSVDLNDVVTVQSGTDILNAEYGCTTGKYPNGATFPYASGSEYCAATLSRISRDPLTGAITEIRSGPINQAFLGTKGIDASVRYRFDAGNFGVFHTDLQWSHVLEQTSRVKEGDPLLSYRDDNSNADFRSRIRWSTSWTKGDWDATALMTREGSFPVWQPAIADAYGMDSRIGALTTWNLTVGTKITDDISVRFNINNVFDKIHPSDPTMNTYPYFWQAYDPVGREVGVQLTYHLK
ncbi:TonB-dependent receptor plug domain-containing protein [Lysobacter claricitrinus]|uniref:TonB-dependent receptor plug domain-containing protein n=1 Tax=Lysobacter claricitrinus TaxID=3367728 RepID=UPI0037DB4837